MSHLLNSCHSLLPSLCFSFLIFPSLLAQLRILCSEIILRGLYRTHPSPFADTSPLPFQWSLGCISAIVIPRLGLLWRRLPAGLLAHFLCVLPGPPSDFLITSPWVLRFESTAESWWKVPMLRLHSKRCGCCESGLGPRVGWFWLVTPSGPFCGIPVDCLEPIL